jgi:Down syndrome cell adhesion molecule-like protein 1
VNKEHVIRGNSAIIKCLIPSFVADFVEVISWHTDQDETYYPEKENGWWIYTILKSASQPFTSCPTFCHLSAHHYLSLSLVVAQHYETSVNVEYVIRGNSAIIKCQVPSFVADFVDIISWHTDSDETFTPDLNGLCRITINPRSRFSRSFQNPF